MLISSAHGPRLSFVPHGRAIARRIHLGIPSIALTMIALSHSRQMGCVLSPPSLSPINRSLFISHPSPSIYVSLLFGDFSLPISEVCARVGGTEGCVLCVGEDFRLFDASACIYARIGEMNRNGGIPCVFFPLRRGGED